MDILALVVLLLAALKLPVSAVASSEDLPETLLPSILAFASAV